MVAEPVLLDVIKNLVTITNNKKISLNGRLQHLLAEMVVFFGAEKGSIMTLSGKKHLEVRASTNPGLVGIKQSLSTASPSTWVFAHKKKLYVDHDSPFAGATVSGRGYKKDAFLLVPILSGAKVIGIISMTDKKGRDRFDSKEQAILLDFAGMVIGALENSRLTESLTRKKRELQEKNAKLKTVEKVRNELFNMLIHDLKGPLSNIVANIDILSYTVDEENREYVAAAQSGCDTLFRMTSDLLDIARLEEKSLSLILEEMAPKDLLAEAASRLHTIALARSVSIKVISPEMEKPLLFTADRGILLRVFQNLLMNAIHHSRQGTTVVLSHELSGKGQICFKVKDEGPGIPLEHQAAIFDKFFQINRKSDGRVYSTGLGLTFCKLAVEAHGGGICVESDGKHGSCFIVTLPLR